MSRQFIKVSVASLKELKDVYEQQIYIYLKQHINVAGYCCSSYSCIADALQISRAKVISTIAALVDKGLIKKSCVIKSNGSCGVNQYYLLDIPQFWQNNHRKEMLEEYWQNSNENNNSDTFSFVKVYYDFIESKRISLKEKALYIVLESYKNYQTGLCFPALATLANACSCCIKTVSKYIKKLAEKGIIKKKTYYNSVTSRMATCQYTLYDNEDLFSGTAGEEISDDEVPAKVPALKKSCKRVKKKKDTIRWTPEAVKNYYNYDELVILGKEQNIDSKYIDIALNIIRHELNARKETFTYKGEKLPHKLLVAEYEKLTAFNILGAIDIYLNQYNKIDNHEAYLKVLLYVIRQQSMLEAVNSANTILYSSANSLSV